MQLKFDWLIVLENLRRGIMVTDVTLEGPAGPRIIYVNRAWLKMTGYSRDELILLTGATGYIGGRLLKELEARGRRVRCLARQLEFLRARVATGTEVVAGDVLASAGLDGALNGVDTAYYLVHSMQRGSDFSEKDRQAAQNFGAAARAAGSGPTTSPSARRRNCLSRLKRPAYPSNHQQICGQYCPVKFEPTSISSR